MSIASKFSKLGPGLLFAGAAIGVSHLVQSTRAGADYGFELIWVIIFANLIKYPFFEFSPRYTVATGDSLLKGYQRQGKWAIVLYLLVTLTTMFTVVAAVTLVTASITSNIFGQSIGLVEYSIILLIICAIILFVGKYHFLDSLVKWIIVLLAISTITAAIFAMGSNPLPVKEAPSVWRDAGILFLIGFIGWMPTTLDIAVMQSVWILDKKRESEFDLKTALFDFNVGYIGTAILAFFFLTLGAMVMFGSDESFSSAGTVFANQFIQLFTKSIGDWSIVIIQIAALTTMFSTTLTCIDGFPRALTELISMYDKSEATHQKNSQRYMIILLVVAFGSVLVIS
ncbi:MAG: Nramp family divalent metal transporter, partial [Calditrichaeota bacterium]|nr:Nramp family divalent metal transporter [Calditrichota bacterium]